MPTLTSSLSAHVFVTHSLTHSISFSFYLFLSLFILLYVYVFISLLFLSFFLSFSFCILFLCVLQSLSPPLSLYLSLSDFQLGHPWLHLQPFGAAGQVGFSLAGIASATQGFLGFTGLQRAPQPLQASSQTNNTYPCHSLTNQFISPSVMSCHELPGLFAQMPKQKST